MKFLSYLLLFIIYLLILVSIVALGIIHFRLYKHSFDLTPDGFEFYISRLGSYKSLFLATVTCIAAYLGLERLKTAIEANSDKLTNDRFNEWKTVLESRILEQSEIDPFMKRGFLKVRYHLFLTLYKLNFNIVDKNELDELLSHFYDKNNNLIAFFESLNKKFIGMGVYPNDKYSYSFDSFRYIIYGSINEVYTDFEKDLKNLYLSKLDEGRTINLAQYQAALNNYRPI